MSNVIDLDKLENKTSLGGGVFLAACPQCRAEGRDKTGNHLKIWPNGAFNCVIDNSKQHNAGILQLVGTEGDGTTFIPQVQEQPKIQIVKSWSLSILDKLIKDYSYFEGRGISAETQKHFKMGVALTGQLNQRVCCPILDRNGKQIVGFSARTLRKNCDPRWKILGSKKSFLYPVWLNENIIKDKREIIFVEGIGCVLTLWEQNIKNVMCLFGTNISSGIISFLIECSPNKIILALNNEESNIGLNACKKLKKTLSQYFAEDKIEIRLPLAKDFNEMSQEEIIKWSNIGFK
jgi:DNA primase